MHTKYANYEKEHLQYKHKEEALPKINRGIGIMHKYAKSGRTEVESAVSLSIGKHK